MNWCMLIPLIVGLLSALFGYLLGRLFNKQNDCKNCDDYKLQIKRLEAELKACKNKKTSTDASFKRVDSTKSLFNAALAKSVFGRPIKENDLTVIEGIGPKIQQLFHNNGVRSWKALAECNIERCQTILDSGGDAFKMHVPGTWPKQARLAYEGKWEKLLEWQDELDGGK